MLFELAGAGVRLATFTVPGVAAGFEVVVGPGFVMEEMACMMGAVKALATVCARLRSGVVVVAAAAAASGMGVSFAAGVGVVSDLTASEVEEEEDFESDVSVVVVVEEIPGAAPLRGTAGRPLM
jgi:hypothetical protein